MPAVGWNDTFDGGTDFSAVATMNMFIDALNERMAWTGGPVGFPIAHVAAGDDFQASAMIAAVQNAIEANISSFSKVVTIAGAAWSPGDLIPPGAGRWTWAAYKTAYLGGNEWTRKYPREFANAGAGAYLDASAFANGHVARNVADGLVYTRTAGAWVVTPAALPDAVTAFGLAQSGDYIGPWLFTEIRDALNRMIWIAGRFTEAPDGLAGAGNVGTRYDGGGNDTSWAVAQGIADADYAADPGAADDSFTPQAITTGDYNGGSLIFSAFALRVRSSGRAYVVTSPVASQVDMYIAMDAPTNGGIAGVFDDQGEGFAYRTWKKFDTQAKAAGGTASLMSATIGTSAEPTPWCAAPGVGTPTCRGYRMAKTYVIQRFDVPGGFTYQP